MVIGLIVAPKRAWTISVIALSIAAMISRVFDCTSDATAHRVGRRSCSPCSPRDRAIRSTCSGTSSGRRRSTLLLALALLALRAGGAGGEWRFGERAAHVLWVGWVLWFGVIESGITTNYLLLPITFMLIAIAVDVTLR